MNHEVEVMKSFAGKNEKVEQIVDDFSAHAFGSSVVTVTTIIPDEQCEQTTIDEPKESNISATGIKLPKNTKVSQGKSARLASKLKDKMNQKKKHTRKPTKGNIRK